MRKSILYFLASAALLALASANGFAQQEYAFPHSIDMQLGSVLTPLSVNGESRTAHGVSDGTVFDIRYTGYITPHFGLFAELGFAGTDLNESRYFAIVNRADGYKYRYGDTSSDLFDFDEPYSANYAPIFKAGIAYRYDIGQVSFRPRVGLGVTGYKFIDKEYERMTDSRESEYVQTSMICKRNYLIDDMYREREPALVLSASAQLTYTFFEHFYISGEIGFDAIPERMDYTQRVVTSNNSEIKCSNYSQSIPDMLNIKFGIGWNIGWNRNYRRGGYPVGIHPIPRRY